MLKSTIHFFKYVNIVQNRIETHDYLLIIQESITVKQYVHNCLAIFSEGRIVEPFSINDEGMRKNV